MEKQIILLNGPSSSGKSTLAKALKELIEQQCRQRYETVSIDDFMKTDPNETIYEDDVYEIAPDICAAVLEALGTCDGVIVDHVITSERIFRDFTETLRLFPIRTVHVSCPPEILAERERERGDRCPGSAQASHEYLYPKEGYDLTVDTALLSAPQNARHIFERLFKR